MRERYSDLGHAIHMIQRNEMVHSPLEAEMALEIACLLEGNDRVGKWLSAALDDPAVCQEMKDDITAWFAVQPKESD